MGNVGYDNHTHSMAQNAANKAAVSSLGKLTINTDGSVDLYFGPKAPSGLESNWVDTRVQRILSSGSGPTARPQRFSTRTGRCQTSSREGNTHPMLS